MISVTSTKIGEKNYKTKIKMNFNVEQLTVELYALIKFMLSHDPAMFYAILDRLMTEITESTYEMDPEDFSEYKLLLEDVE